VGEDGIRHEKTKNRSSMKKQTIALCAGLSLAALAFAPSASAASPSVTAGYSAAQLVDFLIPNSSPISVVGGSESYGPNTTTGATPDASQAGIFAGGSPANNLPFASGVVLTTGRLSGTSPVSDTGILGPNNHERTTHAWFAGGSTALENALLLPVNSTMDAASLSFRFTSTADSFSFQYMFASEEYAENVGLNFNDAFAFILTDTVSNTSQNLAVIGATPVSVNTINNGNSNTGPGSNVSYYTANPSAGGPYDIEFDGMAGGNAAINKLFASANIIPGREYKIELVIADAGSDPFLDSAIFIAQDAFTVPNNPVPEPSTYVGALALAGLVARKLRRKA
jgi:hypothetical protein